MLPSSKSPILTTGVGFLLVILPILTAHWGADGHGHLVKPMARTSMWRIHNDCPTLNAGENDTDISCARDDVDCRLEACGVEKFNGPYCDQIAESYTDRQNITVEVNVTIPHGGRSQFRLCGLRNNGQPLCKILDIQRDPSSGTKLKTAGIYEYIVELPELPARAQCVPGNCFLIWRWIAGNGQDYFGCSDIAITTAK